MPQFSPGFNSLWLQMVEFILETPSFSISLMSTFSSLLSVENHQISWLSWTPQGHVAYLLLVHGECPQPCISKFPGTSVKVFFLWRIPVYPQMAFSMLHIGILYSTLKSFTFRWFCFQFNTAINTPHTTAFPFISCVNLPTVTTKKIIVVSGKTKESYLHNNCLIGWLIKQSSATSGPLDVQEADVIGMESPGSWTKADGCK